MGLRNQFKLNYNDILCWKTPYIKVSLNGCYSAFRVVPAFVAVTAAAGAYLLGKSTSDSRTSGKKNKKVVVSILLKCAPQFFF